MINVSNEFLKLMNKRTDFKQNAEITFADGSVIELSEKDFTISNNNVVDASETNGIPLGIAVCRNIQIELMNDDDKFSAYDFFGAVIRLYLIFQLSETVERIEYGTFTVLAPETYGTTVIITALDDMYKADKDYSTNLAFPTTVKSMWVDACNSIGIIPGTTSFKNDNFIVSAKPEGVTFRQVIGYIAMIAGGNARIDVTGRLKIISYDFEKLAELTRIINGGNYSPWNNPTELDGGVFSPWNTGDVADGGLFVERKEFHELSNWSMLKVDTDDVVITGVQTTYIDAENEEHTVIYGVEGYVLSLDNPLITGQEESAVALIGDIMVGGRFRQFSGDLVSNPTIEFMDKALIIDRKGNSYVSFLTDINFQFFGFTSIKNSAEPALRNSSKAYSDAVKTLVKAKELINNERTAREQAVAQLAKDLKNSSGLFMTEEKQQDGSIIYYMHDKPTLAESMIVWKLTALAFGISTDGGKTYPYGFTVDGTTITRLLYAEGINADYITSGTIDAENINVINVIAKSVDAENISGTTIKGKKYISNEVLSDNITLRTTINGDEITSEAVGSTLKSLLDCYGLEITSSGGQQKNKIGSTSINISSQYYTANLENNLLELKSSSNSNYTEITPSMFEQKINDNSYMQIEGKKILSYGGNLNYAEINGNSIFLYGGSNLKTTINPSNISFEGSGKINLGSATVLEITSNNLMLKHSNTFLGKSGGYIGFFGETTKNTKQTVSNITTTSSATASEVATKLNSLLTTLRSYNLIG